MKSHKDIIKDVLIIPPEGNLSEFDELGVGDVLESMELAAKQAFEEGYASGYASHVVDPKYRTFEDYLKDLEDK